MATKDKLIQIRVSETEYNRYVLLAESEEKSISEFARGMLAEKLNKEIDKAYTVLSNADFEAIQNITVSDETATKLSRMKDNNANVVDLT